MCSVNKYPLTRTVRCIRRCRRRSGCQVGFPIRKFPDQRVLSPPRDLSQSATSFIASCRQGIHQTPLSRLIRPGRRPANPSAEGPGPSRTSLVHSFPSGGRTRANPRTDLHGQHSRLGKIKIPITPGLCKPDDRFGIDLVSLHDVNETSGKLEASQKVLTNRVPDATRPGVVEPAGIEPATLCLQSRCSPS